MFFFFDALSIKCVFGVGRAGKLALTASKTHRNKFEKGNTDVFDVSAPNVGKLEKIK